MNALASLVRRFAALDFGVLERRVVKGLQCPSRGAHDLVSAASGAAGALLKPHSAPLLSRKLEYPVPSGILPREAWLETLATIESQKLGLIDLHPHIFAAYPRIDILHANIKWQRNFRRISYAKVKTRAEVRGGGRKPWQQKGLGRARHGSIRSPLWRGGGCSKGPRGPRSYFYMLPLPVRTMGLRVALSAKYAQNHLHIVDSLDIPSDEPTYLEDVIDSRGWGESVLFVDESDVAPRNFALATSKIPEYNVLPYYGLNVYSMLKHECLVLTLGAVERLEERLLYHMHSTDKPK